MGRTGTSTTRTPATVKGVQAARAPAAVQPAAATLPNTGLGHGVELLGLAGFVLVAAGAATIAMRRRVEGS